MTSCSYSAKLCLGDSTTDSGRIFGNPPGFSGGTVTVLIGINDIGLMMNTWLSPAQQAQMMVDFLRNYQRLLALLTESDSHVIPMEPFIFPARALSGIYRRKMLNMQ